MIFPTNFCVTLSVRSCLKSIFLTNKKHRFTLIFKIIEQEEIRLKFQVCCKKKDGIKNMYFCMQLLSFFLLYLYPSQRKEGYRNGQKCYELCTKVVVFIPW